MTQQKLERLREQASRAANHYETMAEVHGGSHLAAELAWARYSRLSREIERTICVRLLETLRS